MVKCGQMIRSKNEILSTIGHKLVFSVVSSNGLSVFRLTASLKLEIIVCSLSFVHRTHSG